MLLIRVVDLTAASLEEVLARVNGSKVTTSAGEITINTANAQVRALDMNIEEQLTNIISNPTLADIPDAGHIRAHHRLQFTRLFAA